MEGFISPELPGFLATLVRLQEVTVHLQRAGCNHHDLTQYHNRQLPALCVY